MIGVGGGSRTEIDLFVLMNRRARLMGSTLRNRPIDDKQAVVDAVRTRRHPASFGTPRHRADRRDLPLGEADAAYAHFAEPGKLGKVVLVSEDSD